MANLLEETIFVLERNGYTPKDVRWVGTRNGIRSITWKGFSKLANIEYKSGYGAQEIRSDLVVAGKNWWLERHEYDGQEWWEFKKMPKRIVNPKRLYIVIENTEEEEPDEPLKDIMEEIKEEDEE